MLIFLGLALLVLLVAVHELGHMLAAKRNGVEVEEYGIGFPPRLFGRRFSEDGTLYSLNLIPLGGFVKLKGESAAANEPGSFGAASFWVQTKILLAGIAMNFAVAFGLFLLLAFVGLPQVLPNQFSISQDARQQPAQTLVGRVVEETPAEQIGLSVGDKIISIDGREINSQQELTEYTQTRANQEVTLKYRHQGEIHSQTVQLKEQDGRGLLGVLPLTLQQTRYTWSAPLVAAGLTAQTTELTLEAFGDVVQALFSSETGVREAGVGGPVAIFAMIQNVSDLGALNLLLFLMATLSIALATLNVLPIPALDGGRLAVIGSFRLWGKDVSETVESVINGLGFLALIIFIIFIVVIDVQRFFGSFAEDIKNLFSSF